MKIRGSKQPREESIGYRGQGLIKFLKFINFVFVTNVLNVTVHKGNVRIQLTAVPDNMIDKLLVDNLIWGSSLCAYNAQTKHPHTRNVSIYLDVAHIDSRLWTRLCLEKRWGMKELSEWIEAFESWIP
jgi:hypothetical protein